MFNVAIKRFIFRFYVPITVIVFVLIIVLLATDRQARDNTSLFLPIFGGLFSFYYFVQKQQLDELQLFRNVFVDFNERYHELLDSLSKIERNSEDVALNDKEKDILISYFNLCGEEYLYYKKGYIYEEVWTAWRNGMGTYLKRKNIRAKWLEEEKTNSYYGLTLKKIMRG